MLVSSPLSDASFADIFLWCGSSAHSLEIVFRRAEVSNCTEVQLIDGSFHGLCLWCSVTSLIAVPAAWTVRCVIFKGSYGFTF